MAVLREIPEPRRKEPRYSRRPFPAYRFVVGLHPHPTRDPEGHSYHAKRSNPHASWNPEQWRELEEWLYGVDLFNAHYFWEAHESWEGLWIAAGRKAAHSLGIQGLIQIAGALLKVHQRVATGGLTLSSEGLDKLRHVESQTPWFMGLDLRDTGASFETYFEPLSRGEFPEIEDAPSLRLSLED